MAGRKKFLLRMEASLWDEINAWAQEDLRSVNGQIEFLLRETVRKRKRQQSNESSPESPEGQDPAAT